MARKAEIKLKVILKTVDNASTYQLFEEKLTAFLMETTEDFLIDLEKFDAVSDDFKFKPTD